MNKHSQVTGVETENHKRNALSNPTAPRRGQKYVKRDYIYKRRKVTVNLKEPSHTQQKM